MRVILYGDSMTEFLHKPPRLLQSLLEKGRPDMAWEVLNYAIGGTRAELVLYRMEFEYWHGREKMLPLPVTRPDLLVIESCAFNNSVDRGEGLPNFAAVFDAIRAAAARLAPQAKLLFYLSLPPSDHLPAPQAHRALHHAAPQVFAYRYHWRTVYQDAFIAYCQRHHLRLLDVRQQVLAGEKEGTPRETYLLPDLVHPNRAGVELISAALAEAISQAVPQADLLA